MRESVRLRSAGDSTLEIQRLTTNFCYEELSVSMYRVILPLSLNSISSIN